MGNQHLPAAHWWALLRTSMREPDCFNKLVELSIDLPELVRGNCSVIGT
jgi:hypothetical protein